MRDMKKCGDHGVKRNEDAFVKDIRIAAKRAAAGQRSLSRRDRRREMKNMRFSLRYRAKEWVLCISGEPSRPATNAEIFFWMKMAPLRKAAERQRVKEKMQSIGYEDGK